MRRWIAVACLGVFAAPAVTLFAARPIGGQESETKPVAWPLVRTLEHPAGLFSMAFTPDGKYLLTGADGTDRNVRFWDVETWTEVRKLEHPEEIYGFAFSPSGRTMATCCFFPITTWDTGTWKQKRRFNGLNEACQVAFVNETTLVSASMNEDAAVIDAAAGKVIRRLKGHTSMSSSVAVSPDRKLAATASWDDTIRLWDTKTWKTVRVIRAGPHGIKVFAIFSPDGRIVAAGHGKAGVGLWDVKTGKLLRTLKGHRDTVCSAAFTKDGSLLATGSWDRDVRVWEVKTGRSLQTLTGNRLRAEAVAFSPDQKLLVSAGEDKVVRMWEVRR